MSLYDPVFLRELDEAKIRTQYARITLLTWDEKPIESIEGKLSNGGNISVNGSSAVRRTISMTMIATPENSNIEDIRNRISIDKKVKIEIGLRNPFAKYRKQYGEMIWFPCGIFILSSANTSRSTSGWTISITAKDKMVLLNGEAGGTLFASNTFHEKEIQLSNGDFQVLNPTIYEIIYYAVRLHGNENPENIFINDLDKTAKLLLKYMGDEPIYFTQDFEAFYFTPPQGDTSGQVLFGQDVGYALTPFTYPGELVLKAGDTVCTLLDKIVQVLGNFEYFYDVNGHFIFQEKRNFLNTTTNFAELNMDDYLSHYHRNNNYMYELTSHDTVTSINRTPKFEEIKNDFIVWGQKETRQIHYHLVIDEKPMINLADKYMWELHDKTTGNIVGYTFSDIYIDVTKPEEYELIGVEKELYFIVYFGRPCAEWREEMYRAAVVAQYEGGVEVTPYDAELLAEWRDLFDTVRWSETDGWNPAIELDPASINFWFDFIDTSAEVGKYSVQKIGRRTKVVNDTKIQTVFNKQVQDIIFFTDSEVEELINLLEVNDLDFKHTPEEFITYLQNIGQQYFHLTEDKKAMFTTSSTGISAFDEIRELLYQNLSYNTSLSISCIPKYYIEPNNIIYVEDKEQGISGNYFITQYSIPLDYNGTMSITATEVLTRV